MELHSKSSVRDRYVSCPVVLGTAQQKSTIMLRPRGKRPQPEPVHVCAQHVLLPDQAAQRPDAGRRAAAAQAAAQRVAVRAGPAGLGLLRRLRVALPLRVRLSAVPPLLPNCGSAGILHCGRTGLLPRMGTRTAYATSLIARYCQSNPLVPFTSNFCHDTAGAGSCSVGSGRTRSCGGAASRSRWWCCPSSRTAASSGSSPSSRAPCTSTTAPRPWRRRVPVLPVRTEPGSPKRSCPAMNTAFEPAMFALPTQIAEDHMVV